MPEFRYDLSSKRLHPLQPQLVYLVRWVSHAQRILQDWSNHYSVEMIEAAGVSSLESTLQAGQQALSPDAH